MIPDKLKEIESNTFFSFCNIFINTIKSYNRPLTPYSLYIYKN